MVTRPSPPRRAPWLFTLELLVLLVIVRALATDPAAWAFGREPLSRGELWKSGTYAFVHLSWWHVAIDSIGMLALALLSTRVPLSTLQWWLGTLLGGVSCGMLSVALGLRGNMVGISGVYHLFLTAVCVWEAVRGSRLHGAVLAVVLAKVAHESWVGPSDALEHLVGGPVAVASHQAGILLGLAIGLGVSWIARRKQRRASGD